MKAATAGAPSTWFEPPPNVIAVEVCRVSGDLPAPGCRHALSIGPAGEISSKSMVYTDYFVRGREPLRSCVVHEAAYLPYPEPYIAVSAFDGLPPLLGMHVRVPGATPGHARCADTDARSSGRAARCETGAGRGSRRGASASPFCLLPRLQKPHLLDRRSDRHSPLTQETYPPARLVAPKAHDHFAKHLAPQSSRGQNPIAAVPTSRRHREDDQRDVLGEPAARGRLRSEDLDGVSAARPGRHP